MSETDFFVVGLSHHTAPVDIRERLSVATSELSHALSELRDAGLHNVILLSTCNRVEIYGASSRLETDIPAARAYLASKSEAPLHDLLYARTGEEAVEYCFRVAASLDSMVVGEPQILGQVKQAVAAAERRGHLNPLLKSCFQRAFSAAKRIRSETAIAEGTVSISSIAVDLTTQIFGDLAGKRALLVGAGEMAESAANLLSKQGAALTVINRSEERGQRLAENCGGVHRPWDEFDLLLSRVDVCVSSTSSPNPIVQYDQMKKIARTRRGRPLFLVDIAVPRDIDPKVGGLSNIYLYDVDDLNAVALENRKQREEAAAEAQALVQDATREFTQWQRNLSLGPTVVALREGFRQIIEEEVGRAKAKHASSDPLQHEVLDAMAHRLVNKLLHAPLTELKRPGQNRDALVDAVQKLFALELRDAETAGATIKRTEDKRTEDKRTVDKRTVDKDALPAGSAPEGST